MFEKQNDTIEQNVIVPRNENEKTKKLWWSHLIFIENYKKKAIVVVLFAVSENIPK